VTPGHTPGTSTRPTSRSARKSRRPVVWEIEELQGTSRPWDWRMERLQGYLAIFTIMTNVVRELVGEMNLRSVEAFLRFSSAD